MYDSALAEQCFDSLCFLCFHLHIKVLAFLYLRSEIHEIIRKGALIYALGCEISTSSMNIYEKIIMAVAVAGVVATFSFRNVHFFKLIFIISNIFYMFKNVTIDDMTLVFQGRV